MLVTLFCVASLLASVLAKEPECKFGAAQDLLADDDRCDRYWECEDGIISDRFCESGEGFDPAAKKCSKAAPCLEKGSKNDEPRSSSTDGMPFFLQILTKSFMGSGTGKGKDPISSVIGAVAPLFGRK